MAILTSLPSVRFNVATAKYIKFSQQLQHLQHFVSLYYLNFLTITARLTMARILTLR